MARFHPLGGPLRPRNSHNRPSLSIRLMPEDPELGKWNQARQDAAEELELNLNKLPEANQETRDKFIDAFRRLVGERSLVPPSSKH
ncbi:MAG: hypothetical protein COX39_02095 [Candidatus Nealsonbacteria bacterium CG23_combo_of_CG06-09_8_20_14_all_40_13]|uniref:Uncharacterized protein n=1 Tax=Candidatus Nealsonbacteria bacterium CG23_combo_of_CG06-09_8_20_14_all_40_13 TaxID=1974724 RepID=A0A2G9YQT7_9BACT|nr:MAG: hypothetical protein COX39_02095 [Candidatus Nealsonbacteria bacterium CG23_combo_of_CG06-09_8_20_14_all_40_13]PIR70716.1 MAG: hypothetical protein COU44_03575 [Candidatus Nealsonbacteria bacterium CG10_big_fil_rev_8_21_14_0_10_40_24]PIU43375.1 MAG: hypothetical protein COS97_01355 [Candidatus Nealsonbacteria bacterium CG07_land_8_20_14_0_80_40_10]